jgi:hypothetical protein
MSLFRLSAILRIRWRQVIVRGSHCMKVVATGSNRESWRLSRDRDFDDEYSVSMTLRRFLLLRICCRGALFGVLLACKSLAILVWFS